MRENDFFATHCRGVATGVLLAMGLGGAAWAEEWRMAVQNDLDSPEGQTFVYFADKVAEYSGGDLTIRLYPNEQLGQSEAVLEQLTMGAVQLFATGSVFMQKYVPEIRWISAPFMMDDREHWVRFTQTPLVQSWYQRAEEESGVGILGDLTGVLRGPYRVLLSDIPVNSLDDVSDLRLRMYTDQTATEIWQTLGAEIRVLGWAETYEAISRGIVDGVTAPISVVEGSKFYEVAPYILRTDEFYQSIAFMMNQAQFDALPEKDRDALLRAHADASDFALEVTMDHAATAVAELEALGATYTEIDLAPFIARTQELYAEWDAAGALPEGFLDAIEASRAE